MRYMSRLSVALCCAIGWGCESDDGGSEGLERIGEPASEDLLEADLPADVEQSTSGAEGDRLCAACTTNADCGAGNYCLRRSDGVRFCGRDCRTNACPTGYSCTRLSSSVAQCVPPQATCTRAPAADAGVRADAGADSGAPPIPVSDAGASGDVPNTPYCAVAASWDPVAVGFEAEVLRLSNEHRQRGVACGSTPYPSVPALTTNPALRCAARLHSKDMSERNYFSHTSQDGTSFSQRISRAGYDWRTVGENIASGYRTPQAVVDGWIKSTGHCQNLMNRAFTQIGVGFYGSNYLWTQDFGAPL